MPDKRANDDTLLKSVISHQIRHALGYDVDGAGGNHTEAWKRYEGDYYGNETPERSRVMDRTVFEVVEEIMPTMVRIFLGQDEVIRFTDEDEEAAKLATEYVAEQMRSSDAYEQIQDWMKSALISSASALKYYWDDTPTYTTEEYEGVDPQGLLRIGLGADDGEIEVLGQEEVEPEVFTDPISGVETVVPRFNIKIRRRNDDGRIRFEAIQKDEFLVTARATTLEDRRNDFMAHRTRKTRTELRQAGYKEEDIQKLQRASNRIEDSTENDQDDLNDDEAVDESQVEHWMYYILMKHDYDGDGIAEWRHIVAGNGPDNPVIFENEETEDNPFAVLNSIRVPFRFNGYGAAETVIDMQLWKTTLLRLQMDSFYHAVFPQKIVNTDSAKGGVESLDEVMSEAPGGIIRAGDINNAVGVYNSPWRGAEAFSLLDYVDGTIQRRSGVRPMGTALDPNVLQNETAEAVREVSANARARVELIARNWAETGFRQLAQGILRLIVRHSKGPKKVRLGGRLQEIDPTQWNVLMDAKPVVGLGNGNKDQEMQRLQMILNEQKAILLQAGMNNPLVGLDNYYNTLVDLSRAAGAIDADRYWKSPQDQQAEPQQPQPDPKMIEMQQKMALEERKLESQIVLQREKMNMEHQLEMERMNREFALKTDLQNREAQLEAVKMAAGAPDGNANIPEDMTT